MEKPRPILLLVFAAVTLCGGVWLLSDSSSGENPEDPSVLLLAGEKDRGGNPVRRGTLRDFNAERGDALGEVDSRKVYLAIPSYQTIRKEKIRRGSARWALLMRETTTAFNNSLERASRSSHCVLVVEKGSSGRIPSIPEKYPVQDLTQACIASL